jgi:hypothetical protein
MPDMDFRSWVLETYTPVVMVVASPAVEAAVQQRNGLTIADLLRPSGYFHHLSGEWGCQCFYFLLNPQSCPVCQGWTCGRTSAAA